jgi:hypothetical protein
VIRPAVVLCWVLGLAAAPLAAAIRIDPAKTWVGLARVHLTVSEVRLTPMGLDASYAIRVPVWPGGDDVGTLSLRADRSMDQVQRSGGTLVGTALSQSGVVRPVTCEVARDGRLRIDIAMDDRTISFDTRYELADRP